MPAFVCLHASFARAARHTPQAVAVIEPGRGAISYGDLDDLSGRLRDRLARLGVVRGDRVGIYLRWPGWDTGIMRL